MAFVVPGVARYAVNQSMGGRDIVNVLDMRIDTTGSIMPRDEAVADQAEVIAREWGTTIQDFNVNALSLNSVSWVDLDEDDGSTGVFTGGNGVNLPSTGNVVTGGVPANAAALITKSVGGGRGRRNGRFFLAGIAELNTLTANPSLIDPTFLATLQTGLDSFLGDINQDGSTIDSYDSRLCVVHVLTREAPVPPATVGAPLTGNSRDVTELRAEQLMATQRRRIRG